MWITRFLRKNSVISKHVFIRIKLVIHSCGVQHISDFDETWHANRSRRVRKNLIFCFFLRVKFSPLEVAESWKMTTFTKTSRYFELSRVQVRLWSCSVHN